MKFHIAVVILYLILWGSVATAVTDGWPPLLLLPGVFVVLHLLLAYGSYRKVELSRKVSVWVFVMLAIGTAPVGMLLAAFFFLPATQWKIPQDS